MIKTSKQLKDKVRNLSGSDSTKAQTLIRNFIMERFLERIALSPYRNNFILKGGMLVAAVVGLDMRATMDIDTTVRSVNLSNENAKKIIEEIIAVEVPDGVEFRITKISDIMEGHDYPGIRFMLEATLDRMRQAIKIDISTGDVITPKAIEFSYKLMFEERSISIWTYNIETMLGEKLETIMARGTTNTRMRDFYDIYVISQQERVESNVLKRAFMATCTKRQTLERIAQFPAILESIESNVAMKKDWENYKRDSFFVDNLSWENVTACDILMSEENMDFRATIDIDLVLILEAMEADFGTRFWEYIVEGQYQHCNKSTGTPQFYRFSQPKSNEFPAMIELFSRRTDAIQLPDDAVLIPLPIDEDISSLSAILLDDDYYSFLRSGKTVIDGVTVLGAAYLIPFKAKAWLDLSERKEAGEQVDSKNIRKHKNDVFRLTDLINPEIKISAP